MFGAITGEYINNFREGVSMDHKFISKAKSAIVWRGASLFTGKPIQVVLTGIDLKTANGKTGPKVQASIISQKWNPTRAYGTPRERDICGDCPLAGPYKTRTCYVRFLAFRLGENKHKYDVTSLHEAASSVAGKPVRIGAFGDPAAVPYEAWATLLEKVPRWTGYTHAWAKCDQRFKRILMASVETREQYHAAHASGWRTFRALLPGFDLYRDEILCPYETSRVRCVDCGLCAGMNCGAKHIAIYSHGSGGGKLARIIQREFNYER